jgi:hypothetical protein
MTVRILAILMIESMKNLRVRQRIILNKDLIQKDPDETRNCEPNENAVGSTHAPLFEILY